MDKFNAILVFVRVAERGSFTAAARQLGCSISAATKAVARLEEELGTRLINRTTRRLALTDAGEEFFNRVSNLIRELDLAEKSVRQVSSTAQGTVRLVLPFLFGRRTFVPTLQQFYQKYPAIDLQLNFSDRPTDLIESGFDLAVHTGHMANSGVIARRLTQGPQVTAAAPDYLERHGVPEKPDDLHQHNCIYGRFGPDWMFKIPNGGRRKVKVKGNLVVFNGDALCDAAVRGVGIIHATWWALRGDLETGLLTPILSDYAVSGPPVSVVFPDSKRVSAKVRAVIDHLVEISQP